MICDVNMKEKIDSFLEDYRQTNIEALKEKEGKYFIRDWKWDKFESVTLMKVGKVINMKELEKKMGDVAEMLLSHGHGEMNKDIERVYFNSLMGQNACVHYDGVMLSFTKSTNEDGVTTKSTTVSTDIVANVAAPFQLDKEIDEAEFLKRSVEITDTISEIVNDTVRDLNK